MSDARDRAHAAAVLQVRQARNPAYLANAQENTEAGEHLPDTEAIVLRRQLEADGRGPLTRRQHDLQKRGQRLLARAQRLLGIS